MTSPLKLREDVTPEGGKDAQKPAALASQQSLLMDAEWVKEKREECAGDEDRAREIAEEKEL